MKILITNNHLNTYGGSETWVLTVYKQLLKMSHLVHVFTLEHGGGVCQEIKHLKTQYDPPNIHYDLVLCNHNTCFSWVVNNVHYDKLTYISHGTVPRLEQFPSSGVDRYVSVTEEIQIFNKIQRGINSDVILNPIDLSFFRVTRQVRRPPETFLSLCQGQEALQNVRTFNKVEFTHTNRYLRRPLTNGDFNRADLVFSLGRGCYEALAAGRPVIIYDSRGYNGELYDGLVTKDNINDLVRFNCSGRATRGQYTRQKVEKAFEQIQPSDYYRDIAQMFDSKEICKELIK